MTTIPNHVLDAYVARFPALRTLATQIRGADVLGPKRQIALAFARNACRLEAPPDVTIKEIWSLAGVADGKAWTHLEVSP
jgi:hypothetical protein